MPKILGRLRARRERIAKETIERLDSEAVTGPEAVRRFKAAARRIVATSKPNGT